MARGDVVEVVGRLNVNGGRWSLRPDGGGEWRLDLGWKSQRPLLRLIGSRSRVTGIRDGFDLLAVRSVEAAGPPG